MAKIAYILLCHTDPYAIIAQAHRMTSVGDFISIHFDRRSPQAQYDLLADAFRDNPRVVLADRIRCGWGEWSLVAATLNAMRAAVDNFPRATHFYLLSGDCMPIKSAEHCRDMLDRENVDFIESHDYYRSDWIKTGFTKERLIYRHFFNERTQPRLFYASYELQKRLSVTRAPPKDLQVMIGSQWWCLRRATVESVLAFCAARRDVIAFFRTTWIPDEVFFQTVVRHVVPHVELRNRTLTFLIFSDYGMPVNFYDDHYDLLLGQDYLFARKISPGALELKRRLGDLYARTGVTFPPAGEGRRVHGFLTGRGRIGRRFAPRFWERGATLGLDRELTLLVCKKWHVAKRLAARITDVTGVPSLGFLFNEVEAGLPDLGGIEKTVPKRQRHRRALLRLVLDHFGGDRLVLCLDSDAIDIMRDFASDRCTVRIVELECGFTDDYLVGHARRLGLLGEDASTAALGRLLPTLRADIAFESDAIRDAGFLHLTRLSERQSPEERVRHLSEGLEIPEETAAQILDLPHLFSD